MCLDNHLVQAICAFCVTLLISEKLIIIIIIINNQVLRKIKTVVKSDIKNWAYISLR